MSIDMHFPALQPGHGLAATDEHGMMKSEAQGILRSPRDENGGFFYRPYDSNSDLELMTSFANMQAQVLYLRRELRMPERRDYEALWKVLHTELTKYQRERWVVRIANRRGWEKSIVIQVVEEARVKSGIVVSIHPDHCSRFMKTSAESHTTQDCGIPRGLLYLSSPGGIPYSQITGIRS